VIAFVWFIKSNLPISNSSHQAMGLSSKQSSWNMSIILLRNWVVFRGLCRRKGRIVRNERMNFISIRQMVLTIVDTLLLVLPHLLLLLLLMLLLLLLLCRRLQLLMLLSKSTTSSATASSTTTARTSRNVEL
jgi:hypothetical protein